MLLFIAPSIAMFSAPAAALPSPTPESPFTTLSTNTRSVGLVDSDTADGTATAFVWTEVNDTGVTRLSAAWYTTPGGWSGPYDLRDRVGYVSSLQIAVAGSGEEATAHVLWVEIGAGALWYISLGVQGMAGPYLIRNVTVNSAVRPALEAISVSRAMAVWVEGNGAAATTWAASLGVTGALTGPELLDDGSVYTTDVAVLVGRFGQSTALWCATDGTSVSLMQAEADLASNFSSPRAGLAQFGRNCQHLTVAQDFYGSMWAAMAFTDSNLTGHVGLSYAPAGSPFGALVDIAQVSEGVTSIAMRVDGEGFGVIVWSEIFSGPSTYYYSTYGAAFDAYNGLHDNVTFSNRMVDFDPIIDVEMTSGGGALVFMAGTDQSYEYKTFQYTREAACIGWSQEQDAGIDSFDAFFLGLSLDGTGRGFVVYSQIDSAHVVLVAAPIAALRAPMFNVDFPPYGAEVTYPVAIITGVTQPGALIAQGEVTTFAHTGGDFVMAVPVTNGANSITLDAYFAWPWEGCTLQDYVYVWYADPLVPILADLAAAQARVDALNTTLNSTRGDLAGAQAALNASAAELAALYIELNQTIAELDEVKVKFPWLEANATAAQANATLFRGELTSLQVDYDAAQARIALLEAQQNATNAVVQNSTAQNAALAGQVAVLSIVAFASLIAAVGAMLVTLIQSKRGGGGGGGSKLLAHEATHTTQQSEGKVEVRGWDPKTKEGIAADGSSAAEGSKEFSPAEEQLKGNPRH